MSLVIRAAIFLLIPFFLISAYVLVRTDIRARNSRSWPSVNGTVVLTDVRVVKGVGDPMTGPMDRYHGFVRYSYRVDGRDYENTTIGFKGPPGVDDPVWARNRIRAYQVGKSVAVYYDPDAPEISCLEPGGSGLVSAVGTSLWFLILAGLCMFGLTMLPKNTSQSREQERVI